MTNKASVFLWFSCRAEEAAKFYAATFPDTHGEAISIQVHTNDQAETDRLWSAITSNGGAESQCGWCKDRFGLSWQVTPRRLTELMADPDRARSKRVFDAMMTMKKIDIAALNAAAEQGVADA